MAKPEEDKGLRISFDSGWTPEEGQHRSLEDL